VQVPIKEATIEQIQSYDIIINNVSYPNTFREDIRLDRTILEDEFANQPGKYAYWSTLLAYAKDQESKLKRAMGIKYAQADNAARLEASELQKSGDPRKFTEKMFEGMAKTNADYQRSELAYFEARLLSDLLRTAEDSMSQRKEMLISLGAHARQGASDVRVMAPQVREYIQNREPEQPEQLETTTEKKRPQPTTRRRKPTS